MYDLRPNFSKDIAGRHLESKLPCNGRNANLEICLSTAANENSAAALALFALRERKSREEAKTLFGSKGQSV